MIGHVDGAGRAILAVQIVTDKIPAGLPVGVWIDTGFTEDIVFPKSIIEQLGLSKSGSIDAILADGSQIELATFS